MKRGPKPVRVKHRLPKDMCVCPVYFISTLYFSYGLKISTFLFRWSLPLFEGGNERSLIETIFRKETELFTFFGWNCLRCSV